MVLHSIFTWNPLSFQMHETLDFTGLNDGFNVSTVPTTNTTILN